MSASRTRVSVAAFGATIRAAAALGIAGFIAATLPACAERDDRPGPGGARVRNAVVIVVDTLRWDHVGAYGHERPVTPHLDALARSGTLFQRAYSPAPWTKPAIASLFTGLFPGSHGVRTMKRALPAGRETLAERLRGAGFRTGAVVSHVMLARRFGGGLDRGFEFYREAAPADVRSTPWVSDQAVALLREFEASGERFLLFVHYFDPHFDYLGHPEYGFAAASAGRLDGSQGILELRAMRDELRDDEIRFLRDRYDEEVRFTDAGIGRLLASLDELGLAADTVVVATADHGEEFLERGWLGHTRSLYEELVRVPLLLRIPQASGTDAPPGRIGVPVSTVSLAPTLLDLLGVAAPQGAFQAPSLAPLLEGTGTGSAGPVFLEVDFEPESPLHEDRATHKKAIVEGRFKLIRDDETGRVELYDLEDDPLERNDLADREPGLRRRLEAALARALETSRSHAGGSEPDWRPPAVGR